MLRNTGFRAVAFVVSIALSYTGAGAAQLSATCGCSGSIDEAVQAAVKAQPKGGPELTGLIRVLVEADATRTQDVVCISREMTPLAVEAAAEGLAEAGLSYTDVAAWVCCGGQGLLASFHAAAYGASGDDGSGSSVPQCFGQVAGTRTTGLVTPSLSSTGYGEGFGTNGGSGGNGVTPSQP